MGGTPTVRTFPAASSKHRGATPRSDPHNVEFTAYLQCIHAQYIKTIRLGFIQIHAAASHEGWDL